MDELGRSPAKVVWGKESRKRTRREANECGRDQWNVKIQIALRPDQVWWCRWLERMIRRACGSLPFTFQTRKKKKPQVSTSQLLSKKSESVSRFFLSGHRSSIKWLPGIDPPSFLLFPLSPSSFQFFYFDPKCQHSRRVLCDSRRSIRGKKSSEIWRMKESLYWPLEEFFFLAHIRHTTTAAKRVKRAGA